MTLYSAMKINANLTTINRKRKQKYSSGLLCLLISTMDVSIRQTNGYKFHLLTYVFFKTTNSTNSTTLKEYSYGILLSQTEKLIIINKITNETSVIRRCCISHQDIFDNFIQLF